MNPALRTFSRGVCAAVLMGTAAAAFAATPGQAYPTRPVRMIVPFAPGGPTDTVARILAHRLTEAWGQQVVVDNRAGAGGNIGMGIAAGASPDGHTILVVSSSFVVNPGLYKKIPYDPYRSFVPVSNVAASPNVFVVHPSVPAKSLKELLKIVSADPRKYNFATPGIGTTPDLSAQLLRLTTRIDVGTVPYGGAGPAVAAVVGNQVPLGCMALPPTTPHIQAGRLRALAVTGAKRSQTLPDVPTMAEAGFPGQEADTLQGVLLPAGTPRAIVAKLHGDLVRIVAIPEVKERILTLGFEIVASRPEGFAAQIRNEVAKWRKVVKDAGIQVN
ncbi:MAG: tripartite tricarboxylate transporter substrate binding protein [Betaproteobacteria bacterium]|nr:tripartite tricarboxylate transporter substrate binding protein [Betaproteobacteria bacterium]